ncbi:MAG: S-methyl-5-thioribose-1-phosphate isomerase [Candidatus Omnitrophica bacterium]|nr:S-methyl-5-thioribose-1-phosphate isomerase [Candidatus Omnitrophota bacterium]
MIENKAVWMEGTDVCLIDQRRLPHKMEILRLREVRQTVQAIREMAVRGAGSIGAAAGFAMAQAALMARGADFFGEVDRAAQLIRSARPTAKNLFYAVDQVLQAIRSQTQPRPAAERAAARAQELYEKDVEMTRQIAETGLSLLPSSGAVLTHCNAGWLAYPGWGTALAPLFLAHQRGIDLFVYADETRPRSQGAKLTVWELAQAGIQHLLIADTMAGTLMKQGRIGAVFVGADRIAANGDTANKIGTYGLAVLAKAHGIPFYVAAPSPTFDFECPDESAIPIEERAQEEVLEVSGLTRAGAEEAVRVAPHGTKAFNPAFDVTPAEWITGFVTEKGLIRPQPEALERFLSQTDGSKPAAV